jgi:5'-deoxynucleotidase
VGHFFAYLARMRFVKRWGLMRNTHVENLQEHSLQVAMLAHALAVDRNTRFGAGPCGPSAPRRSPLSRRGRGHHRRHRGRRSSTSTPRSSAPSRRSRTVANARLESMLPAELAASFTPLLFR